MVVGVAGSERGVGALEGVLLDVRQGDLHAGPREGAGHCQAHAAGRAGDERDPSCYLFHGVLRPGSADGITGALGRVPDLRTPGPR